MRVAGSRSALRFSARIRVRPRMQANASINTWMCVVTNERPIRGLRLFFLWVPKWIKMDAMVRIAAQAGERRARIHQPIIRQMIP